MSATDNLGPHLLGRTIPEADERDYPLAVFLKPRTTAPTELEVALAAVQKSHAARSVKAYLDLATPLLEQLAPDPGPQPPAPPQGPSMLWTDAHQLDQGQTGHCVGFGCAQFGNTLPFDDNYADADGHAFYYAAKRIDGEPDAENGSSVHSGAKALQEAGRIANYAWAADEDEVAQWVLSHGPMVVGTDWYDAMFSPDESGVIVPVGNIAGGHCYLIVGYDTVADLFTLQNSWGTAWGQNGYAKISRAHFGTLLRAQGEAMAAVELAV